MVKWIQYALWGWLVSSWILSQTINSLAPAPNFFAAHIFAGPYHTANIGTHLQILQLIFGVLFIVMTFAINANCDKHSLESLKWIMLKSLFL